MECECELCLWKPTVLAKYILEAGVGALSNGIEQKQAEGSEYGLIMRQMGPRVCCLTNGFVRGGPLSAAASVECRPAQQARLARRAHPSPQRARPGSDRIGGHIDTEGPAQVVTDAEGAQHIRLGRRYPWGTTQRSARATWNVENVSTAYSIIIGRLGTA